jgi:putative hemolysin
VNIKLISKLPTLIKAYIKFNASIGTGAVIDNKFKTTDVFVFLPIEKINKEYVNKILD